MKKICVMITCLTLLTVMLVTGCSGSADDDANNPNKYLELLEEGKYYVVHADKTYEEIYWGAATFSQGETVSGASDKRVAWYDESMYNRIPTLYIGDSLIYKTSEKIVEEFVFERFEDLGYSVGICGLQETDSGRYSISTSTSDNNTFPNGDTDALLLLTNDRVIIERIDEVELRVPEKVDGIILNGYLTRCNSIANLTKDMLYDFYIYEGTYLHMYSFKADKRLMCSMEVRKTNKYKFENEITINISIPSDFNSGYYMMNGQGMFRYVNGAYYDETTDFNVPNPDGKSSTITEAQDTYEQPAPIEEQGDPDINKETVMQFTLPEAGAVRISVHLKGGENPGEVTGAVIGPDYERADFTLYGSTLESVFEAATPGVYTVQLYGARETPDISASYVK